MFWNILQSAGFPFVGGGGGDEGKKDFEKNIGNVDKCESAKEFWNY